MTEQVKNKVVKILFIVAWGVQVLNCTLYDQLWYGAWYQLNSLSTLLFVTGIYIIYKYKWKIFAFLLVFSAYHQFIDELFFNPTKIELNEYISSGIILTLLLMKLNGKYKKIF